jgi:hypothetical protein
MPEDGGSSDLDAAPGGGAPEPSAAPPQDARPRASYKQLLATVIIAFVVVGALAYGGLLLLGMLLPNEIGSDIWIDIPPAGQIWFGESFDTDTQTMTGISDTFATADTFTVVVHVGRVVESGDLRLHVVLGDDVVEDRPLGGGEGDIIVFTAGPLDEPGTYELEAIDAAGDVLASGEVTLTDPRSSDQ